MWNIISNEALFVANRAIIGHSAANIKTQGNWNLYSGSRENVVFFNEVYLFLNYIKKINLYKKIARCSGLDYYFVSSRGEFIPLLSHFAKLLNGRVIHYKKSGDLMRVIWRDPKNFKEPLIFLLNNDSSYSVPLMKEIRDGSYLTIGISDSDACYGNSFVKGLYGNDDSLMSLNFIFNVIVRAFTGVNLKKKNVIKSASIKRKINEDTAFFLKKQKKKDGKKN